MEKNKNNKVARKDSVKNYFKEYKSIVKRVSRPTVKKWWHDLWRVVLIVTGLALFLLTVDYVLMQGVLSFQSLFTPLKDPGVWSTVYIVALVATGILTVITVLLQEGTGDGLSSLFGSNIQYGGIGVLARSASKIAMFFGVSFALLCLFAPVILGGLS